MIELFGYPLGTIFQGGTMAAMITLLAIVGRAWIVGIPERLRIANEGRVTAAAELAERYKAWRVEVHGLKNDLGVVAAKQALCDKALVDAHAENRQNHHQMTTMLFLIRLLLRELERLSPESMIVQQAKVTLEQMGHEPLASDKSTALASAEHTVEVAQATVEEVKQAENGQ